MENLKILSNLKKNLVFLLLCITYIPSYAQEASNISNTAQKEIKDNHIGFLIIGGILGFGITAFIIISIIEKRQNKLNKNGETTSNEKLHRTKRVIKKTS